VAGVLSFGVLGPLEVRRDGQRVPLRAAKPRALLALLLIRRGEVHRDVLLDALWGEGAPAGARNTLQVYVSRLRRELGAHAIVTTASGYRLERGEVDADRFEELLAARAFDEALALWRGQAFGDLRYEAFVQAEAGRLDELRLACMERRADSELAHGRHAALVSELEALVVEHPLRERLRGQLILALYRSGRQAEALAQYQAARRMLSEDLGLEPSMELKELERMILAHDPGLAPPDHKPRSNLPYQPTPFIGREQELADLMGLVRGGSRRLVTLTGPGGSGKTRLAIEASLRLASKFEDGVWWVPLQSLADPESVDAAIAGEIGASAEPERHIRDKKMLLLLDNFEHLLGAAGNAGRLLSVCPNLFLLVTSREPLDVAAERTVLVPPMDEADAIALFEERSMRGGPAETIAQICRRVDCLPLAVELAAARTRLFAAEELLRQLGERLPVLIGGPRDAPMRQQTLRATLEWSYDLLTPEQQAVFTNLGAFAGGCTLEAAVAVCQTSSESLDALIDKNLLAHQGNRYLMLETVHEFARDCFRSSRQFEAVSTAHLAWYAKLVEEFAVDNPSIYVVSAGTWQSWWQRLAPELDNVRAMLRRLLLAGERQGALRLMTELGPAWKSSWALTIEGRRWLTEAMALQGPGDDLVTGHALAVLWSLLRPLSEEREGALRELARVAAICRNRELDYTVGLALAADAQTGGDPGRAMDFLEKLPPGPAPDRASEYRRLHAYAESAKDAGNYALSRSLFERTLDLARELDHVWICQPMTGLADVYLEEGLLDDAEALYRESLDRSVRSLEVNIPEALAGLAAIAASREDLTRAGLIWGAIVHFLRETGGYFWPADEKRYARFFERRTEDELQVAIEEGKTLNIQDAVNLALGESSGIPRAVTSQTVTTR
jgi:predicted ATPase/DNA-binding SARP family transcriptional activator